MTNVFVWSGLFVISVISIGVIIGEVGVWWGKFQRKRAIKDKWEKASNGHFCKCVICGFFHAKGSPCFAEAVIEVKNRLKNNPTFSIIGKSRI